MRTYSALRWATSRPATRADATGDLDRDSADQVLDLLRRLASEHMTTVVMVTHDLQASEYATRVVNLDKGELVDAPAA